MFNIADSHIGIEAVDFYVPDECRSVYDCLPRRVPDYCDERLAAIWNATSEPDVLFRFLDSEGAVLRDCVDSLTPDEAGQFINDTGIHLIHCASSESCSDMAVEAASRLLAGRAETGKAIDGVICFHSTLNEEPNSSIAGRLQYELGLKGAFAFAVGQKSGNCSMMALKVGCHLMVADPEINRLLLVGADKLIPPYPRLFAKATLAGDAACAMMIRRHSERFRILRLNILDFSSQSFYGSPGFRNRLLQVNSMFSERGASLIRELLSDLAIGWSHVALLLVPNFSLSVSRSLARSAGAPWDKVWTRNLSRYGYLTNSDLAVNLATALAEGKLAKDDIVLAVTFGLDLSVGCLALQV